MNARSPTSHSARPLPATTQPVTTRWAIAGKGRALWLVGDRTFQVQTVLTEPELRLTYTNDALTARRTT